MVAETENPITQAKVAENKKEGEFRNYTTAQKRVHDFYETNHTHQTLSYVLECERRFSKPQGIVMGVWEALEYLDKMVDDSDPDTELSQLAHALQTAEAIRRVHPDKPWLQLTGLIHDLGKVLMHPSIGLPQWSVVGDTNPVGCKFSDKIVLSEYFVKNPDHTHPIFSSEWGIYRPGCGLSNVHLSYGHDEFLYQICMRNKSTLPLEALYCIRFHSFYSWHREHQYEFLTDEQDRRMLPWILEFNKFDLYSKDNAMPSVEELKPYYQGLIAQYFPAKLEW